MHNNKYNKNAVAVCWGRGVSARGCLPMGCLSRGCLADTPHEQNNRRLWKHYRAATTLRTVINWNGCRIWYYCYFIIPPSNKSRSHVCLRIGSTNVVNKLIRRCHLTTVKYVQWCKVHLQGWLYCTLGTHSSSKLPASWNLCHPLLNIPPPWCYTKTAWRN